METFKMLTFTINIFHKVVRSEGQCRDDLLRLENLAPSSNKLHHHHDDDHHHDHHQHHLINRNVSLESIFDIHQSIFGCSAPFRQTRAFLAFKWQENNARSYFRFKLA